MEARTWNQVEKNPQDMEGTSDGLEDLEREARAKGEARAKEVEQKEAKAEDLRVIAISVGSMGTENQDAIGKP